MSVVLFLALALSAQTSPIVEPPPAEPPAAPEREIHDEPPVRVFQDAERAALACKFGGDEWSCDPSVLHSFNVEAQTTSDAPAGLLARMAVRLSAGATTNGAPVDQCVTAIHVEVKHELEPLTLEWKTVSLGVDGVAKRVLPGFTRRANADLSTQVSSAGAGIVLAEDVLSDGIHVIDEVPRPECLFLNDVRDQKIVVDLPIRIGERNERVRFEHLRKVVTSDEKAAFALVPMPVVAPAPDGPTEEGTAWGGIVGGLIGVAACGGACGGISYLESRSPGFPLPVLITQTTVSALVGGGSGGICGYLVFDAPANERARANRDALVQHETTSRRLAAWKKKREQLEIAGAQAAW